MRVCHKISTGFDDPNLVSCAGLVPVMRLAERAGLHDLADAHLRVAGSAGSNPAVKVATLVAGMVAGADSIDDVDLMRHGGMDRVFTAGRAPSTLGTFLRGFTFGHVRQLDAVASRFLVGLAARAPLLQGADQVAYVDIDDMMRETYGYQKEGAGYGYNKIKGLNAFLAILSTPLSAPVIAGTRLRRGPTNSTPGAARLIADTLACARKAGATGTVTVRADSAYYDHGVVGAARRGGARFSITARMDRAATRAITTIGESAWVPIKYPQAIWDEEEQQWVSDAQVAEVDFTAFTSRPKAEHVTARLIVRRVKRLNPTSVPAGQGELFSIWRPHAVFTDSAEPMLAAEATHRDHAIIEKVIADLKGGAFAHLPSGKMNASAAWLVLAAMAFNLTRAAGTLASRSHAKATTATIRAQLITVPARIAYSARRLHLHLPERWPWEDAWNAMFAGAYEPVPATWPPKPHRRDQGPTWKTRVDRPRFRARNHNHPTEARSTTLRNRTGGSRLSGAISCGRAGRPRTTCYDIGSLAGSCRVGDRSRSPTNYVASSPTTRAGGSSPRQATRGVYRRDMGAYPAN